MQNAEVSLYSHIPENSSILVLGSGSGEFLEELLKRKPRNVVLLDASSEMLKRTQVSSSSAQIQFVNADVFSWRESDSYDCVLTPYFLDLFPSSKVREILVQIDSKWLKPGGLFIVTDFAQSKKIKHQILLKIMYWFFRLTVQIEARELPGVKMILKEFDWELVNDRVFYGGLVQSFAYRKK